MIKSKIPQILQERALSARQLALKSGVSLDTANRLAKGEIENVRLSTLLKVARTLGFKRIDSLFKKE